MKDLNNGNFRYEDIQSNKCLKMYHVRYKKYVFFGEIINRGKK